MKKPYKIIYLIEEGDEYSWCEYPDPGEGVNPKDSIPYILKSEYDRLKQEYDSLTQYIRNIPDLKDQAI